MDDRQRQTPYLDALSAYAAPQPSAPACSRPQGRAGGRPGAARGDRRARAEHGRPGADPRHRRGRGAHAVRAGPAPGGGGVGRQASMVPDQRRLAGQPRRPGLALAHRGGEVVVQRNAHSSTIDALVLSGMRPTFAAPEVDSELGIAHCLTPETLERGPGGNAGSGRGMGDLADLLRRGRRHPRRSRRWPTRAACRWSWTRRGGRTWPSTRRCPSTRWRRERTW